MLPDVTPDTGVQPSGQDPPHVRLTNLSFEYLPAEHVVHAALPIVFLNEPAPHCVHAPPFGPVNPALHEQLLESVLPIALMAFTGQLAHEETPVASLYFPTAHKTHRFELTLPGGALVAPGQLVHAAVPVVFLYFPPAHAIHLYWSGPVYPTLQKQSSQ